MCQLFKKELQYMGNTIFIKDGMYKIHENKDIGFPPTTSKGCRSFARVVNFLCLCCPELQKLLKPIYDLKEKEEYFIGQLNNRKMWMKSKGSYRNLQYSICLTIRGDIHLYSDTIMFTTGSAFYQIKNGQARIREYTSKWMPTVAQNYSINKLELCGLAINITTSSHLLKRVNFHAVVDHSALTHIVKSKLGAATNGIKRLYEVLSSYINLMSTI